MTLKSFLSLAPSVLLAAVGVAVALIGRRYGTGTLTAMGPGFLPVMLGVLLATIAGAQLLLQWRAREAETPPGSLLAAGAPLALSAGSILLWALLVETLGFIPAALGQLALASLAARHENWRQMAFIIVAMSVATYLLFVRVLGMPVPAFGG